VPESRYSHVQSVSTGAPGLGPRDALLSPSAGARALWRGALDTMSPEQRGAVLTPSRVIALQALVGNMGVTRLIARAASTCSTHGAAPPVTVQRIGEGEKGALAREVRKAAIAEGLYDKTDWKLHSAAQAQYWSILVNGYPGGAEGLAVATMEQAVGFLIEHYRRNPPPGKEKRSEPVVYREGFEFAKPITLVSTRNEPITPQVLEFDIAQVGVGRVALFRGLREGSYADVLAWFSHGVQVSEGSAEADRAPAFAFTVPRNSQMIRPASAEGYRGLVEGARRMKSQGALGRGVPDMVLGHHGQGDFNEDMRRAVAEAFLPACSVAILYDFVRHENISREYDAAAGGILGHQFLHLRDVVDALPELRKFETWLMLCCRSLRSNIEAGQDRPQAYPTAARGFDEAETVSTPGVGGGGGGTS
jgi:hypothetical protein